MHALLVCSHVAFMMVAFGASPLGRLGLRYLMARASDPASQQAIARGFAPIFLAGGISVTAGVATGVVMAWHAGLGQTWVAASVLLITIAGIGGVAIEDRWLRRLSQAKCDAVASILAEKVPLLAAMGSPVLWLVVLWLMIDKPA